MNTRTAIGKIRLVVSDETKRIWDDTADMLPAINEARAHLWDKRPEAFFVSKVIAELPNDLTSTTVDTIDVTARYAEALVARAAHELLMQQRRDGDKEKAAEQLETYDRILGR